MNDSIRLSTGNEFMTGSVKRRTSTTEIIAEPALKVLEVLLMASRTQLDADEVDVTLLVTKQINYRKRQVQQRTFYYYTESTPEGILRRYLQLTTLTDDEGKTIQRIMQQRQNSIDLEHWAVATTQQQHRRGMSRTEMQSPQNNNKRQNVPSRSPSSEERIREEHRRILLRIQSDKDQIKHRREQINRINEQRISQKLKEQESLIEEVRNLKKSKIKQRLEYQRILRSKKNEERKIANEAYLKFIREYHQVRPLHELRQSEFKMREEMQFRQKESQRKSRVNTLLKPLSLQEFEQHERKYVQDKRRMERELISRRLKLVHEIPRKEYYRGRSHQIIEEEYQKVNEQQQKDAALQRIREYYENILKKLHKPIVRKDFNTKELVAEEPLEIDRKERMKSLGDEYLQYNKGRGRTEPRQRFDSPSLITRPASPHSKRQPEQPNDRKHKSGQTTRRPSIPIVQHRRRSKPISIRDHYDVEQLIYQNSRKDEFIRRAEQLSHVQPIASFDELELRYIDSIREKLNILNSLS